tara:strand:- start:2190 stop:6812 length:4623 start_codon:yes stop_codon:yes gene_type:complete
MEQEPIAPVESEVPVEAPQEAVEAPVAEAMQPQAEEANVPESAPVEVYEEESEVEVETYTEPVEVVENEHQRNADAIDEAALEKGRGGDFNKKLEEVTADSTYMPKSGIERAEKYRVKYMQDVERAILDTQAKGEAVDIEGVTNEVATHMEASMGIWGQYRSEVDLHPQQALMTPEGKDKVATMNYISHESAKVLSEMGVNWDTLADVSAMLFAPDVENIRMKDVATMIGMDYTLKDGLDYSDFFGRMATGIRNLPPEKAVLVVDTITEGWEDILGDNRMMLGFLLMDLTGDYSQAMKTFEARSGPIDQALSATIVGSLASRAIKTANAVRKAAKLKDVDTLVEIVNEGTKGKLIKNGVDIEDAASSVMPLEKVTPLTAGADSSLAAEVVSENAKIQFHLDEINKVNTYGLGLNEAERAAAVARKVAEMENVEGLTAVTAVEQTNAGFVVSYTTGPIGKAVKVAAAKAEKAKKAAKVEADKAAQKFKEAEEKLAAQGAAGKVTKAAEKAFDKAYEADKKAKEKMAAADKVVVKEGTRVERVMNYTTDDIGEFVSNGEGGYMPFDGGLTSPNARFIVDRDTLVQLPEQMQFQSAKIRESYDNAIRASLGDLKQHEMKNIDKLLTAGDEGGVVFNRQQMMSGSLGHVFSEKEVKAYEGIRQVVHHMYMAKNKQILDSWRADGIKTIMWGTDTQPVKRYGKASDAATGFSQATTKSHMVGLRKSDGGFQRFDLDPNSTKTRDIINKKYEDGYELARVTNGRLLPLEETNVEWAFVRRADFQEPTGFPLSQRVGYMPKVRKNGNFFVKERKTMNIGGKEGVAATPKTVRYFDNHTDAKKWADAQPNRKDLDVLADGEMSSVDRELEYQNISGSLFGGARSSEEIPFGLPEQKLTGQREDALHGLQRYVNHLAKQMPYNLYRMGIRQRWENTAKELGGLLGQPKGGFDDLVNHLDPKHPAYKFLKDSHNQVKLISGVPTDEEKKAREASSALAYWLERKGLTRIAAAMHGKNVPDEIGGALRGATFHTLLGIYNPAQYLIQASGAFIALSINPVHGLKAIGQSMGFQVLDRMVAKNPEKMSTYLKWLENTGVDVEGYRMWHKSGLKESITSSNIDYEGLWANLPYDASVLRKILANDTFFFKSGELVSARVSFATAYNRFKALNKGKDITDNDLPAILARTEQYRLNMSKANAAKFQTGLTSVPAQFQQVNTKFMEKVFGTGELTGAEKIRMATGQAALFGTMGIPIVGYVTPVVLDYLGLNAENLSEAEMRTVRNGALTWFFNDFMDVNSIISGRMSLGGDFVEKIFNAAVEPTRVVEIIGGPSYSIWEKGHNMVFNMQTVLMADFSAEGLDANKTALVTEVLAKSLSQFAGPLANTYKAYDMTHSKFYKNKSGKPLFEMEDNNWQTIMFQAFGFSSQEVADYYELNNRKGGMIPAGMTNVDAKRIVYIMNMLAGADDEGSQEAAAYAMNAIKTKYNAEDQEKLIKQVTNLIKHPDDPMAKNVGKILEESTSELSQSVSDLSKMSNARTSPRMAREMEERGLQE